jgi:hypothetical protein
MTSPYEKDDSAPKKKDGHPHPAAHKHVHEVRLMEYRIQPGEQNISAVGRKLITEQTGKPATGAQLSAFLTNVYEHTGLKTKEQQNNVHAGDELWIELPVVAAPVKVNLEHKPLPDGDVCSDREKQLIGDWVTQNEVGAKASPLTYNPNDHGHGVSVGLMQWNQKKGKLPELLQAFHDSDPRRFDAIFGGNAQNVLNVQFVKQADFTSGALNRSLIESLTAFQSVQYELRNKQVELGCEKAYQHNFTALRGVGVSADLVNHLGPARTEKVIHQVPIGLSESARIDKLEALGEKWGVHRMTAIDSSDKLLWKK